MPYNDNGEFYSDLPGVQGGVDNNLLQMFKDAINRSQSATYRSGAQAALGAANAIGGVYGSQISANTATSGQNIQKKSLENTASLGAGELDVNRGKLDLAREATFMPMPKGVGSSQAPFNIKKAIEDYLRQ
jgi:hypothetical protein